MYILQPRAHERTTTTNIYYTCTIKHISTFYGLLNTIIKTSSAIYILAELAVESVHILCMAQCAC